MAGGITKLPKKKEKAAIIKAEIKKGNINLLKLTPELSMAIISVSYAILDVKKITEINVNKALNRFAK